MNLFYNNKSKETEKNFLNSNFDAKISIDSILNYVPLAEKYSSKLSSDNLSLALSALNFVATIIDPDSIIEESTKYIGLKYKSNSKLYCLICHDLVLKFDNGKKVDLKRIDQHQLLEFVKKYKQRGLIFDLDGTVFDTNCIRKKREKYEANSIPESILNKIQLIEGFEDLFMNPKSELYLKENKVLFITNSPEKYAKYLLKLHKLDEYEYESHFSCYKNKSKLISEFVKKSGLKIENFIAFGDEEKDAQLYSQCGIPFYIVNKYYGYDIIRDLMTNIITPDKKDFRHEFMYDVIKKKFDFDTKYFDDFIVYYCRYYDKNKDNFGRCPSMSGRNYFKKITCSEFKYKKGEYVKSHLSDLMEKDYKNIGISLPKNAVFVKIPGHNETSYNPNSPCSILIKELCQKYGKERDYSDFLIRSSVVRNHDSGRDINDHVKTIIPIKTKKITGKIVYLFDDVCTTGTQMSVCIDKLYKAGAGHVICFCICRTCPGDNYKLYEIEGGSR